MVDHVTQHRGWVIVTRAEQSVGRWAPIWSIRRDRRSPSLFTEVLPDRTTSPMEAQALAHLAPLAWLYRSGPLSRRPAGRPSQPAAPEEAPPELDGC